MSYYLVAGCYFSWGIRAFVLFFLFVLFLSGVGAIGGGSACIVVEKKINLILTES